MINLLYVLSASCNLNALPKPIRPELTAINYVVDVLPEPRVRLQLNTVEKRVPHFDSYTIRNYRRN